MTARLDREETITRLREAIPVVLPSLLLCDFGDLVGEVRRVEAAGAGALHFDVMDGHFVPNFTYGMPIIESVRSRTPLVLDVHLMIEQPQRYIAQFYEAGANVITIHSEAVADPAPVLADIRSLGAAAGLAINPATPASAIEEYLPLCDVVLVMGVQPGFGGQSFNTIALEKLRQLSTRRDVQPLLEIDGGVHVETIGECAEAGAELFVVGSAIFKSDDYGVAMRRLNDLARTANK